MIFCDRSPLAIAVETERDVAHLSGQVAGQQVHVVDEVLPGAGEALDVGLTAELALGAHLADHARNAGGDGAEALHHRLHGCAQFAKVSLQGRSVHVERHVPREVPVRDEPEDGCGLADRPSHLLDKRVDRVHGHGPRPAGVERRPLRRLPFEPYAPIHAPEFAHQRIVLLDEGIEGERDLAHHPVGHTICGQANREVSLLGRPKRIP